VAQALSAQSGDALAPSGAAAANSLGLSTQVPARASYATSGRTRTAKAGGRSVTLKHSRAPVLDAPESVNAIVQALAHLGKGNIDADAIGASPRGSTMPVRVRSSRAARPCRAGWATLS
jgi:hypothetical protein